MAKVPVFIVNKFKIRKGELFFYQFRQFFLQRFCPLSYKNNKLVNCPSHSSAWHLRIVAFELGIFMLGLRTEVLFRPYLAM